jgi:hypothetical protein
MALLFSDRPRSRAESLRRGELLFDFYDECARTGYDEFRSVMNGWFSEVDAAHHSDFFSRMQRGGNQAFGDCLCELIIHALLRRLGYNVDVHPTLEGRSTRPDFALTSGSGERIAYVEVKTIHITEEHTAQGNRENPVYNSIDGIALPPGCILDYELVRGGTHSPRLAPLVADITQWAIEQAVAARTQTVYRRFSAGDWVIELGLFSAGGASQASRAIGSAGLGGGFVTPHRDIRKALNLKARKYGALDAPYLIVVADGKDQLSGTDEIRDAITEAVFGDEVVEVGQGQIRERYVQNGFWRSGKGPQNQHVSGVLLLPDIGLWRLRNERFQPLLAINPCANLALPQNLLRLPHLAVKDDRWVFKAGENIADILELPSPWPPED